MDLITLEAEARRSTLCRSTDYIPCHGGLSVFVTCHVQVGIWTVAQFFIISKVIRWLINRMVLSLHLVVIQWNSQYEVQTGADALKHKDRDGRTSDAVHWPAHHKAWTTTEDGFKWMTFLWCQVKNSLQELDVAL